jgi:hypothetical protein
MPAQRLSRFALAALAAAVWVLASACPAVAQKPADKDRIEQAIKEGRNWLQDAQKPSGYWGDGTGVGPGKGWGVGYTALAGLTLSECLKNPETDPGLKRAAAIVRQHVAELEDTYEIALAILFLDRMKGKSDKRLIQWLGGRLVAAQMPSGGWGYKVAKRSETETNHLLAALRKMAPPEAKKGEKDDAKADKKPAFDPEKARKAALAALPSHLKSLPVFDDPGQRLPADAKDKRNDLADATTDNSNTHFAMLGVWTARKYDVPVDRTFVLVNRRYRTTQGANGTWGYDFAPGGQGGGATTSIALLGIAIGHVVDPPQGVKPEADPVVLNALVALSGMVGEPVGDTQNRPEIKQVGGLYYLWAMERVAVLYDIQKLGKKDWHLWGAEILICHQRGDGSWDLDGGYHGQHPVLNTCFALLFLKRANLTPDLSKRLLVNTSALTKKVDEKVSPKLPPPPKVETPEIAIAPPPHEVLPKPQPVAQVAAPAPPPEPAPEPPPAKKSPVLWIVLGVLLVGSLGGGLAFLAVKRKNKDEDEDEDEKLKKKGKKKAKVKAAGAEKPKAKKKVRAEVEEEE